MGKKEAALINYKPASPNNLPIKQKTEGGGKILISDLTFYWKRTVSFYPLVLQVFLKTCCSHVLYSLLMSVDISSLNICGVPWALLLVSMRSWGGFQVLSGGQLQSRVCLLHFLHQAMYSCICRWQIKIGWLSSFCYIKANRWQRFYTEKQMDCS